MKERKRRYRLVTCPICDQSVTRLSRHACRKHGHRPAGSPEPVGRIPEPAYRGSPDSTPLAACPSDHEEWWDEPHCTIDPPDDAPAHSGTAPETTVTTDSTVAADSRTTDASTQESGDYDPRARIRLQLFGPRRQHLRIRPRYEPGVEEPLDPEDLTYADPITPDQPRHLCDCERCIRHMTDLRHADHPAGAPTVAGIRLVRLPGVALRPSTPVQRLEVNQLLLRRPELTFAACGCRNCTIHRNFVQVYLKTWQENAKGNPPAVGSCRAQATD